MGERLVAYRALVPQAQRSQVATLVISLGGHVDRWEETKPLPTLHLRIPEGELGGFEFWLASLAKGGGGPHLPG